MGRLCGNATNHGAFPGSRLLYQRSSLHPMEWLTHTHLHIAVRIDGISDFNALQA
jgi:hypothetical protein